MTDPNEKTALICYSRTGHSAQVAEALANRLGADSYTLSTRRYPPGILGFLHAGFDTVRQAQPAIEDDVPDLSARALAIFCGPVWASAPAVPLRAFWTQRPDRAARTALFLTGGTSDHPAKAFSMAENDLGQPLAAQGYLSNADEATDRDAEQLSAFIAALGAVASPLEPDQGANPRSAGF